MNESTTLLPTKIKTGLVINDLDTMQRVANIFVASGLFEVSDKETAKGITEKQKLAQAVVKIQAGQELGIPPFAAMRGLYIVKGKIEASYQLLGSLIRRQPGYDYKVLKFEDDECKVEFLINGTSQGICKFDMDDAKRSEVQMYMYKKYPRTMLMARAMSTGVNAFMPEVFLGAIYTPEDFGGNGNEETTVVETPKEIERIPITEESIEVINPLDAEIDYETGEFIIPPDAKSLDDVPLTNKEMTTFLYEWEQKGVPKADILKKLKEVCEISLTEISKKFTPQLQAKLVAELVKHIPEKEMA